MASNLLLLPMFSVMLLLLCLPLDHLDAAPPLHVLKPEAKDVTWTADFLIATDKAMCGSLLNKTECHHQYSGCHWRAGQCRLCSAFADPVLHVMSKSACAGCHEKRRKTEPNFLAQCLDRCFGNEKFRQCLNSNTATDMEPGSADAKHRLLAAAEEMAEEVEAGDEN